MFSKLVGNDHIKEILKRFISNKRVPNSLLFAGEEGIGKRLFALEFAKSFVCQNPKNGEACNQCPACARADRFTFPKADDRDDHKKVIFSEHADIGTVIPYKRNILVDAIRHLETEANFRPFEAASRFFIIDDADKMNAEASNALLKTLEEPPASSHIFLISSRPDALLPTIRSRVQTLRFAPIETEEIKKHLLSTKQFSQTDAEILAKLAHGRLGSALELDLEKFRARRELMFKVLQSLLQTNDRAVLLQTAEEMNDAKNKDDYEKYLDALQTLIHDIWTLKIGGTQIINADIKVHLKRFTENADSKKLSNWLTEIELMRERFAVNINKKIATDALFMQMAG
ncbi:MAG: ATP-binding protein [Pyrinomonadaceae bacterium]